VAVLEELRHNYAQLAGVVPAFETIDGTRPIDEVAGEAAERILRRLDGGTGAAAQAVAGHEDRRVRARHDEATR